MLFDIFTDEKLDDTKNIRAFITPTRARELEISLEKAKYFAATYKQRYLDMQKAEEQPQPPKKVIASSPLDLKIKHAFEKQNNKLKVLRRG